MPYFIDPTQGNIFSAFQPILEEQWAVITAPGIFFSVFCSRHVAWGGSGGWTANLLINGEMHLSPKLKCQMSKTYSLSKILLIWCNVIFLLYFVCAGEGSMKLHCCVAAYVSDYAFLGTALLPYPNYRSKFTASLDHAMWFHSTFRSDEWMLYECESPWAGQYVGPVCCMSGALSASANQKTQNLQIPKAPTSRNTQGLASSFGSPSHISTFFSSNRKYKNATFGRSTTSPSRKKLLPSWNKRWKG